MKIYYAHSMHLYNTEQEKRDITFLESLGFEIINPNTPEVQTGLDTYRYLNGEDNIMDYFNSILDGVDGLAFRGHVDGKIPSGVGYEIKYILFTGKPIFEIPNLLKGRFLDIEDTREYLKQFGNR